MTRSQGKNQGFIALISVIVIVLVLATVIFTLSFTGFLSRFNILDGEAKEASVASAEACADIALLKLADNSAYTGNETVTVGSNSCTIGAIVNNGTIFTVPTEATVRRALTKLVITASASDFSIVSWKEVPPSE